MISTPTPPAVRLLPPGDAYDYPYFRDRLADPSVLEDSVAVCLYQVTLLAVAVGGPRLGGYLSVDLLASALAIRRVLAGRPGFLNIRVRWSPRSDTCHVAECGDQPPVWGDVERGRFYGYSGTAITAFLQEQTFPTPGLPLTA